MRSWTVHFCFFFFNDTATTEIYTLSLHDALPICAARACLHWPHGRREAPARRAARVLRGRRPGRPDRRARARAVRRLEEHTSELQSRQYLVCRLLLEKKKNRSQRAFQCLISHILE